MQLFNIINDFENNKILIIRYWLQDKEILHFFKKYNIDVEYFVKHFAVDVLVYYIEVLKDNNKIGSCPSIANLINYLKEKQVTSQDLFVLCSGFKKALFSRTHEIGAFSYEVYNELTTIYEKNFFGVLQEYSKLVSTIHNKLEQSLLMVDKYIIMSRTDLKGNIIEVSEPFCELSGYSKEELIGKNHNILRDPETPKEFYQELWNSVQKGEVWQGEIKNRTKKGEVYWVYTTIQPQRDSHGNLIYFDAIRQNITTKKLLEEQHHMLVEQSKSAAMGEMISMIAHQWRQPLQAISILVQKLPLTKMIEGELTDEMLDNTVEEINQQLTYMSTTIDDFREFFKPTKQKRKVRLSQVIERALSFLSYMFKMETISVFINKKDDVELELYDKDLVQVLINIMKNAKDALVEKRVEKKELILRYWYDKYCAYIEIEDNAGGISQNLMHKIFEPYFTTKENKNGTGLGLYMSKMIIEQHSHGKLSVRNSNKGAVFAIELLRN